MKTKVTELVYRQAIRLIQKDLTHEILLSVRDRNNCMKVIFHYDNGIPIDLHYVLSVENYVHFTI